MVARDVMTRDPHAVPPGMHVWGALALMREHDVRHLLVVDGSRLVGVVSNRDYRKLLERVDQEGVIRHFRETTVVEIMTPGEGLVTAGVDTPIREVADSIVRQRIGCVPIVDGSGTVVGILTQKDVLSALLRDAR